MSPAWLAADAYRALVHCAPTMYSLDANGVVLRDVSGPPAAGPTTAAATPARKAAAPTSATELSMSANANREIRSLRMVCKRRRESARAAIPRPATREASQLG